ncbi:MAG TPA: SEC-C metal-binding domain-containing protein [Thermoanaerobaculia bacterium]|jgi:tetratricopeptide (TPR) repeat protein|nr:SEC-C metal-binding domain-containing protein [Thermoanaerobaculia bacterium]
MTEETFDDATLNELETFFRDAIVLILEREESEPFLAWMREEAAVRMPRLFGRLPDEAARRSSASEFGRSLWNSVPLPGNGFRPRPVPNPERNDSCPCGSGLKYKKCCAPWAADLPSFDPEGIWRLVVEALPLERVEALGQFGRVPRHLVGDLATSLLDDGDPERALALVQPMFEHLDRLDRLDERDAAALNVFLESLADLDLMEEKAVAVERLAKALKPALRAVLWEDQVRHHAMEGELEEAWEALEKARKDDPESGALGPLEVSLLMSEGQTAEAGERARFFLDRARRDPEAITEAGREFLDKVAEDPESAQLEFSLGEEVKDGILRLQKLLTRLEPPSAIYGIVPIDGDQGAGQLVPPGELRRAEEGWDEAFFGPEPALDADLDAGLDEDEEDVEHDPWNEEEAARWLAYFPDEPTALDSLEVLEDLSHAVSELGLDQFPFLDRPLLKPILDRALTIVRQALAAHPEVVRLPEDAEPNGSALALIAAAAALADRLGETDRGRELLEWLDVLDPVETEEGEGAKTAEEIPWE